MDNYTCYKLYTFREKVKANGSLYMETINKLGQNTLFSFATLYCYLVKYQKVKKTYRNILKDVI